MLVPHKTLSNVRERVRSEYSVSLDWLSLGLAVTCQTTYQKLATAPFVSETCLFGGSESWALWLGICRGGWVSFSAICIIFFVVTGVMREPIVFGSSFNPTGSAVGIACPACHLPFPVDQEHQGSLNL